MVIEFLENKGWTAQVNPDEHGIDIIAVDPFQNEVLIEVEVKNNWDNDKFPFDTIHLPERKRKFIKRNSVFCILNKFRDKALFISSADFVYGRKIIKDSTYQKSDDYVEIPETRCRYVNLRS